MLAFVARALLAFIAVSVANAHLAVFHEAMYCLNVCSFLACLRD